MTAAEISMSVAMEIRRVRLLGFGLGRRWENENGMRGPRREIGSLRRRDSWSSHLSIECQRFGVNQIDSICWGENCWGR